MDEKELMEKFAPILEEGLKSNSPHDLREMSLKVIKDYFYFGLMGNIKICTHCHEPKDRIDFGADYSKPDGLFAWCRTCRAERYKVKHAGV